VKVPAAEASFKVRSFKVVIPAKSGIQSHSTRGQVWVPAFAGMTLRCPRKGAADKRGLEALA
jgi:hypothetical protein